MLENNAFRLYAVIGSIIVFGIFTGLVFHNYDLIVDSIYEFIGKRFTKY